MMDTNEYGYGDDGRISLSEACRLLKYENMGNRKIIFASLKEQCQLTPGLDVIRVPRGLTNESDKQQLQKMKDYLTKVYENVNYLAWPRANQQRWSLENVANLTTTSVHTAYDITPPVHLAGANQNNEQMTKTAQFIAETAEFLAKSEITRQGSQMPYNLNTLAMTGLSGKSEPHRGYTHNTQNNIETQVGVTDPNRSVGENLSFSQYEGPIGTSTPKPQYEINKRRLDWEKMKREMDNLFLKQQQCDEGHPTQNRGEQEAPQPVVNAPQSFVPFSGIDMMIEQRHQQQKMAQLQLLSSKYDTLDGMDSLKFRSWADSVKQRLELLEVDEKISLLHIKACLSGNALRMYEGAQEFVRKSLSETWRFLENRFGDMQCDAVRESTFHACNQTFDQNVRQYVVELESRCFLTREKDGYETVMITRMSQGLREPQWRKMATKALVKKSKPGGSRLNDLVELIEEEENCARIQANTMNKLNDKQMEQKHKTFNSRHLPVRGSDRPWCQFCRNYTHSTDNCRKGPGQGWNQQPQQQQAQQQQQQQQQRNYGFGRGQSYSNGPNYNNGQRFSQTTNVQPRNFGQAQINRNNMSNMNSNNRAGGQNSGNTRVSNNNAQSVKDVRCPNNGRQNVIQKQMESEPQVLTTGTTVQQEQKEHDTSDSQMVGIITFQKAEGEVMTDESKCEEQIDKILAMRVGGKKRGNVNQKGKFKNKKKTVIMINGMSTESVKMLMDTGASGSMISPSFLIELQKKGPVEVKPGCKCKFVSFTGQKIECEGTCRVRLSLKDQPEYEVDVHISRSLIDQQLDVLLGSYHLRKIGVALRDEFGRKIVGHGEQSVKKKSVIGLLREKIDLESDDEQAIVVFKSSLEIMSEDMVIRVNLKDEENGNEQDKKVCGVNMVIEDGENEIQFAPDLEEEQYGESLLEKYELSLGESEQQGYGNDKEERNEFDKKIQIHSSVSEQKVKEMKDFLFTKKQAFSTGYTVGGTQNVEDIGRTDFTHKIDTGDHPPVKEPLRRLPLNSRPEVKKMIEDLLSQGCIKPSESEWRSAIVLVKKKDGSLRMCIDYRKLNEITTQDSFPIPMIDDLIDRIGGWTVCSSLDIKSGYHNIRMNPEDAKKTAFSALDCHYEWAVMPFGLTTAPATFCRAMNVVLTEYLDTCCVVYLDDILVFSKSYEQHLIDLGGVLDTMEKAGFKLNPKKCMFLCQEIEYLGHVVSPNGIKADPKKVEAIAKFPRPENKAELWRFLGLAGYLRRFYRQLSETLAPLFEVLTSLEKHTSKVQWTEALNTIFETAKVKMASPPVLAYPRPGDGYKIMTDACAIGLGATLEQKQEEQYRPIAFASRRTTESERKLDATTLEAKAVLYAVEKFHPYILGEVILVVTDHKPLLGLFKKSKTCTKLERWAMLLQSYNIRMMYAPGEENVVADALSRAPIEEETPTDRHLIGMIAVDDKQKQQSLLKLHHNEQIHTNSDKLYNIMKYWYSTQAWPDMRKDCQRFVNQCNVCKMRSNRYEIMPLQAEEPPEQPRMRWHLDFCEVRRDSQVTHMCLGVDAFSRYVVAVPTSKQTADMALKLVDEIINHFGVPQQITTDNGAAFISRKFQESLQQKGIKQHYTTPYLKTGNSLAERALQTIQGCTAKFMKERELPLKKWYVYLKQIVGMYNKQYHDTLKMSPFKVMFGVEASLTAEEFEQHPIMEEFWQSIREKIMGAQMKHAKQFYSNVTKTSFNIGDKVFVRDTLSMGQRSRKIDMPNGKEAVVVDLVRKGARCEFNDGTVRRVPIQFLQHRF